MIELKTDADGNVIPIEMVARQIDTIQPSSSYNITTDDLGPLKDDNSEIKVWLREVWYFTLAWSFRVKYPGSIDVADACYEWNFVQKYDFTNRANFMVSLEMVRSVCYVKGSS